MALVGSKVNGVSSLVNLLHQTAALQTVTDNGKCLKFANLSPPGERWRQTGQDLVNWPHARTAVSLYCVISHWPHNTICSRFYADDTIRSQACAQRRGQGASSPHLPLYAFPPIALSPVGKEPPTSLSLLPLPSFHLPIAASRLWNTLPPQNVTSSPSLTAFYETFQDASFQSCFPKFLVQFMRIRSVSEWVSE